MRLQTGQRIEFIPERVSGTEYADQVSNPLSIVDNNRLSGLSDAEFKAFHNALPGTIRGIVKWVSDNPDFEPDLTTEVVIELDEPIGGLQFYWENETDLISSPSFKLLSE